MNFSRKVKLAVIIFYTALPQMIFSQQIAESITKNFPASTVIQLNDITSKIWLSQASQIWLAKAYSSNDSLVAEKCIKINASSNKIQQYADSLKYATELSFKHIMQPSELVTYEKNIEDARPYAYPIFKNRIEPMAEMNSQFGIALKLKKQLRFRDKQADSLLDFAKELRQNIEFYEAHPDSGFFDRPAFESKRMSLLFTNQQYTMVLAEKNKKYCFNQAKYDWHELTVLGLSTKYNKDSSIQMMTVYNFLKTNIMDCFAHEPEKRDMYLKSLKMPACLRKLRESKIINKVKTEKYAW